MAVTGKKSFSPLIPEGYSTLSDAHKRIRDKWGWGNPDGLGRFKWYLTEGTITVCSSDGLKKFIPEIWANPKSEKYLADPDDLYSGWEKLSPSSEILFLTSDLDKVLPRAEEQAERDRSPTEVPVASTVIEPKAKGGRPTEHDWSAIWVEMCAYIDRDGPPDAYAPLVDSILSWFQEKHKSRSPPARSEVHLRAKLLIDRIRSDNGLPPIT
jgi:hypothetical protein